MHSSVSFLLWFPSSVAFRPLRDPWTWIMPAKVIMLMHANGERDSNDGEKWCSSYTRGLALYEKINRGRFTYIYIYIFPYSSFTLLSSSFFSSFIHSFSSSISRFCSLEFIDRSRKFSTRVTAHSNKLFFIVWWVDQAVNKEKSSLLLHFGSLWSSPILTLVSSSTVL